MIRTLHLTYLVALHTYHTTRDYRDFVEMLGLVLVADARKSSLTHLMNLGQVKGKGRRMIRARRTLGTV